MLQESSVDLVFRNILGYALRGISFKSCSLSLERPNECLLLNNGTHLYGLVPDDVVVELVVLIPILIIIVFRLFYRFSPFLNNLGNFLNLGGHELMINSEIRGERRIRRDRGRGLALTVIATTYISKPWSLLNLVQAVCLPLPSD